MKTYNFSSSSLAKKIWNVFFFRAKFGSHCKIDASWCDVSFFRSTESFHQISRPQHHRLNKGLKIPKTAKISGQDGCTRIPVFLDDQPGFLGRRFGSSTG